MTGDVDGLASPSGLSFIEWSWPFGPDDGVVVFELCVETVERLDAADVELEKLSSSAVVPQAFRNVYAGKLS